MNNLECNFQLVKKEKSIKSNKPGKDLSIYCGLAPFHSDVEDLFGNIEEGRILCDLELCPLYQILKKDSESSLRML